MTYFLFAQKTRLLNQLHGLFYNIDFEFLARGEIMTLFFIQSKEAN